MELMINGDYVEVPSHVKTIADLLTHFSLDQKVVIVEHNRDILEKGNHQETVLSDRDKIEIVHFVGGG
ncbi:sulfur carrier protein ThiS [Bacillus timonensis]|nr:sulfur carrier protein ThiS [Bacillus timonensis]